MSAPTKIELGNARPLDHSRHTPDDLAITPRDQRFCRENRPGRWWLGNDPVATAWHNALSIAFPQGEAFFIEHVRAHRDGTPPKLEAEIRAFIRQEANHTREHASFNRAVRDAGYDTSGIDARTADLLAKSQHRSTTLNLAATTLLEHLTAMMARETLTNDQQYQGSDPEVINLWRWHAVEEIEHKGVAFDTWNHATITWPRHKRWMVRCLTGIVVSRNFLVGRIQDTLDLMAQDGLTGWKWKGRLAAYLLWKPGILRRILIGWAAYFMPGFHPWKHDDRALIQKFDSEFSAAIIGAPD